MNRPARACLAVDAMGGDGGVAVTVAAARAFADRADIVLVGDAERLRAALGPVSPPALRIVHAAEQISESDALASVLRHKPDSSMRRALQLHADGEADGVVSGGGTAALMALSRQLLDHVAGMERPAICKMMQGTTGPFWMLDLGANLECTPEQLHQFACAGATLARYVGGCAPPRVALLNIGSEPHKGPQQLQAAAARLQQASEIHYVGFIEGNRLFSGDADVVVADGFAGNIALKAMEGAAGMVGHLLSRWLDQLGPVEQVAMTLARSKLLALRRELNPQYYNGASFVGLKGVVVKSHGSADAEGFQSAIGTALKEIEQRIPERLAEAFPAPAARP